MTRKNLKAEIGLTTSSEVKSMKPGKIRKSLKDKEEIRN